MATRRQNVNNDTQAVEMEEPRRGSLAWLAWTIAALFAVILLFSVLHMSGALSGPEEAVYQATKDTPVLKFFTGWMHEEEWEEELTPDQIINVKDLRNDLIRAERKIDSLEKGMQQVNASLEELNKSTRQIDKLDKTFRDIMELGYVSQSTAAEFQQQGAAAAPQAPAVQPGTPQAPAAPAGAAAMAGQQQAAHKKNFRIIAKIFEEIDPDTAVEILSHMTDEEKVLILSSMKEDTVAELLSAFDSSDSAKLARALAAAK